MVPALFLSLLLASPAAPESTLVVRPGSGLPTVSAALAAARAGDTIVIEGGDYHEPLLRITRPVTILGRGAPVLHGGDHGILAISADNVTIRGLVLRDVTPSSIEDRAAITVTDARGCQIDGNVLQDTFFGIYLSSVTGCRIRGNRIGGSGIREVLAGNAIHAWSSSHLIIEDNELRGHRDGIYFEFTTDAEVRRNLSSHQLRYGIHFMFSQRLRYEDNQLLDNGAGVAVMYSQHIRMTGNRIERTRRSGAYGLLLKDITDSRLERNHFVENTVGLFAEGTSRVTFQDNEFVANGWAVQVMANAVDNTFSHNRFEANSFDVSTNSAHAATQFRENYWDRYSGYDLDRDGFGDVPYPPVRLFAVVVQQNAPALILLRSFFVSLLDAAERVAPVLTPQTMVDARPLMAWNQP